MLVNGTVAGGRAKGFNSLSLIGGRRRFEDRMTRNAWLWLMVSTLMSGLTGPAFASDLPASLTCDFKSGSTGGYDNGKFTLKPTTPLSFNLTSINLQGQSADMKMPGAENGGKLAIARGVGANHFLEVVTEGYWNITTVYELDAANKVYPAVHSRHFGLLGQPVVAQYTGLCKATPEAAPEGKAAPESAPAGKAAP
jgi:hypothetical protein